jgi:hypothetical protein
METQPTSPGVALLGRLFWIIVGPMFLAIVAFGITQQRAAWVTLGDLAYFLILGGMLLGRWLEFHSGDATTGTGEPATPAHLRRYMLIAPLLGLALWVTVKLLGNYGLGR